MQIRIMDCNGMEHRCDSADPGIIGAWFAEHAELLMSADVRTMPYPMYIYPQTAREQQILSGPERLKMIEARMTQDGLLELAQKILDASARLGELEETSRQE
jgi:hypothetical protein